jgi:hypothetical protein
LLGGDMYGETRAPPRPPAWPLAIFLYALRTYMLRLRGALNSSVHFHVMLAPCHIFPKAPGIMVQSNEG